MPTIRCQLPSILSHTTLSRAQQTRCFVSTAPSLGRRTAKRLQRNEDVASVLRRVSYYVEAGCSQSALKYFRKRVSMWDIHDNQCSRPLFEGVLDLFIRNSCFTEAESLINSVKSTNFRFSPPMRAKLLTVKFVNNVILKSLYFNNLKPLFGKSLQQITDTQFCELLHILADGGHTAEVMETVATLFTSFHGNNLGPSSISFLIQCYVNEQCAAAKQKTSVTHGQAIEKWLDYHAKNNSRSATEENSKFCIPYNTLIATLLRNLPRQDPQVLYEPVLERMSSDGAWADTVLINTLIQAEARCGNVHQAFVLYGKLRDSSSHGILPDGTTFSQLFSVMGHQSRQRQLSLRTSSTNSQNDVTLPRILFREMLEVHKSGSDSALNKISLTAALWYFVISGDYAGACVALSSYTRYHIGFEESTVRSVLCALAERCLVNLKFATEESSWATIFLDVPPLYKDRIKRESVDGIIHRMKFISKGSLAKVEDCSNTKPNPETKVEKKDVTPMQPQTVEKTTLRSKRLAFIDFLISRALATRSILDGIKDPIQVSEQEVMSAALEMLPSKEHISNSIFKN